VAKVLKISQVQLLKTCQFLIINFARK